MLYTIKQISVLTGLSKVSIYKRLKLKELEPYITKKQGITYVQENGFNLIKDSLKLKGDRLKIKTKGLNNSKAIDHNNDANQDNKGFAESLTVKSDYLNYLKAENERLWQQLGEKDTQIKQLQKLVENGQVLLKDKQQQDVLDLAEHFENIDNKLISIKNKMQEKKYQEQNYKSNSIFKKHSFEIFSMLIFGILAIEEIRSIKYIYDNFISRYFKKCLNSFYYFLSYSNISIDMLTTCTIKIAISLIPEEIKENMTIFLTIDDTLQSKFGTKFDCYFHLFDHTNKTGNSYLDGHCFVSLVINIPLLYKGNTVRGVANISNKTHVKPFYGVLIFKGLSSSDSGIFLISKLYSPRKFICSQLNGDICLSKLSSIASLSFK